MAHYLNEHSYFFLERLHCNIKKLLLLQTVKEKTFGYHVFFCKCLEAVGEVGWTDVFHYSVVYIIVRLLIKEHCEARKFLSEREGIFLIHNLNGFLKWAKITPYH